MNENQIHQSVTRIFSAAGRRPSPVEYEVYSEALSDLKPSMDQSQEATVAYIRSTDFGHHSPSPSGLRNSVLAIMRRDRMRVPALPESEPSQPVTESKAWIGQIRAGLQTIGTGGVPLLRRKHLSEFWQTCGECKVIAKEVAMEAGAS